jgi:AcrR family transcriptional regulator
MVSSMGRPRQHNDETRERLLRVASQIIRRGGTEALTVRGLADEAGVTTRAIYSLFSGLPELIAVLCARSAEAMVRHHEAVPVTDDPISELLPLGLAYRSAALEQADLCEMIYTPTITDGRTAAEYPRQVQRTIGRVQDTIRRAILAANFGPSMIMTCFRVSGRSFTASRRWSCVAYSEHRNRVTVSGGRRSRRMSGAWSRRSDDARR